ncbi:uncharacterized protein [Penaeus vannamei]|uniref:uncharacterized protein n=1 Tax=Penaeus vannamei TaxID=6689 RepID=UPI00387F408C
MVKKYNLEGPASSFKKKLTLGLNFNKNLTYTGHVRNIAKKLQINACVRRISHLLDASGCETLYKSQVRPIMEYCPLVWSPCPPSYLNLLDKIQDREKRLIQRRRTSEQPTALQPLQQRRDVSGKCVMYKVHEQQALHLTSLLLPRPPQAPYSTRTAPRRGNTLEVPFARTELYLQSFLPKYSRMWNTLMETTAVGQAKPLTDFKAKVNTWIKRQPP